MWGSLLKLFASIAAIAEDKILMRHIDNYAELEKTLFELERVGIVDQDDVAIVDTKKLMQIEKRAIADQLTIKGKA